MRLGMLSHAQDSTIADFFLGIVGPTFEGILRPTMADLEARNPDRMRSYVRSETTHTMLFTLDLDVGGVTVGDWVDSMVNGPAQDWVSISE